MSVPTKENMSTVTPIGIAEGGLELCAKVKAMTPVETRQFVRDQNARARETRAQQDRAHQDRMAEIARTTTAWKTGPTARAGRINFAAVYAERNRPRSQAPSQAAATGGPRSFSQLAAARYSAPEPAGGGGLIGTSGRGGGR